MEKAVIAQKAHYFGRAPSGRSSIPVLWSSHRGEECSMNTDMLFHRPINHGVSSS